MSVSEEARVFQVRGFRCSKEPTVLGLSPVRLGNRTYRAWSTPKLTPMVRFCGVHAQIWFPIRGNPILLRSENALHLRSAFLTEPGLRHKLCIPQKPS